jgi:hypothetical protein
MGSINKGSFKTNKVSFNSKNNSKEYNKNVFNKGSKGNFKFGDLKSNKGK